MAQKDTAAGVTEEKTAEKAAAPKFTVEKLAAVEEMKAHIKKWCGQEVK